MNKKYVGIGLVLLAFLLVYFIQLNGLSTFNLFLFIVFGIIAWVGIYLFVSAIMPNPAGPKFSILKTILKAVLGFFALFLVMMIGIKNTSDYVNDQLDKYGVTTKAIVIDKKDVKLPAKRGRSNHVYYLVVSFNDESGNKRQVKSEVAQYEFSRASIGSQLTIKYSSKKPGINELYIN